MINKFLFVLLKLFDVDHHLLFFLHNVLFDLCLFY